MNNLSISRICLALAGLSAAILLSACGRDDPSKFLTSARDYQAKGDHPAAIIQLKNVLQVQPENGEARLLLGKSSMIVGDAPAAVKEFRKALEYGQPEAQVVPLVAAALLQAGDNDKLVSEFASKKLDDAQADAELKARVGEAQLRLGKEKDAAQSFAAALVREPSNARAQLGLARLKARDGKLDEASAMVDKVVAASPTLDDALLLQAEIRIAKGDKAGARTALERAVAASPGTPGPHIQLIALLVANQDLDAATQAIAAARAARVPDLQLQYFEAVVAMGRKDLAKAREVAQGVLKRAPGHVQTMVLLGYIDLQEKRYADAESQLSSAIVIEPNHFGARALLARSYLASRQPARAMETLRPVMASDAAKNPAMSMLIGEVHLANGELKDAAPYFQTASHSTDQESMARTRLGQIAMATGNTETGLRELESIAADEGAPVQADMALLSGYVRQGQTAKALEVAQGMVKKRPNDPMAHHALGSVRLLRKELPAARAAFTKALELNPTYMPAVVSLAQLDWQDKKPGDARARFEAVLAKEPQNEFALLGLAEVMSRTKAPASEVAAVLERAITANPRSVNARVTLVNLHLSQRDTRAALTAAQQATVALPDNPRILDSLGRAQMAAGETNQAIETYNRMAAAEPRSPVPHVRLASVYLVRKEPEKAVEALTRAQKLAPSDATITRDLAAVQLTMGKADDALKQAKDLQRSLPKSPAGFLLEGDVHSAGKQWPAAEKAYREGLKVAPDSGELTVKLHAVLVTSKKNAEADALARKWLADHPKDLVFRGYLAELALRSGDLKSAVTHYQAILAQQPGNVLALNNAAWAMGRLGDPKAMEYAERALKEAPDSAAVLDTVGMLWVSKGDAAKGVEYLGRAVEKAPERHEIRLNYAKALLKVGRKEDARKELTRLQAVSQEFPGKAEIADLLKQ